jgi:hypothetical protein
MANWPDLMFRARVFAATEPGFLANHFLELVALNGGPLGYSLNLGVNLATPEGRGTADFHAALALFCYQLRDLGVGHIPFNPAPHHPDPLIAGPDIVAGNAAAAVPGGGPPPHEDQEDHDFVEIIGGVDPVHGPWLVDHDFVEIVGGVHPILGPWVEGPDVAVLDNQPVEDILPMDGLADMELEDIPNWDPDLNFDFDLDLLQ